MPFRKDHLQLVTDAGATLDIGWAYGTPYSLDPINGVDVDVQTAQGVNQVGVSVERQSVAGVSRELIIHCHSSHGDADAELLLEKLPYFTSGTMYFEDKFFCRFVLSKTPYTKSIHPYPVLAFMLFCPKPFWYDLTAQSFCINGFVPSFRLPINYSTPHRFGVRTSVGWLNAVNPGALAVPFTATLKSDGAVVNPTVLNIVTGQSIRILTTLTPGRSSRSTAPPPTSWLSSGQRTARRRTSSPCWMRTATCWSWPRATTYSKPPPTAARPACR